MIAEQYFSELGLSPEQLDGWNCQVYQRAGKDAGVVITKGSEIHFASLAPGKAITRKNVREAIQPLIDEFGFATTRTLMDADEFDWLERLGFSKTWADEHFMYWATTTTPFSRASK